MAKLFVLNIKSGIVHNKNKICHQGKRMKKENAKSFDHYQDVVDYYEDDSMEVHLCSFCFPERTIGGILQ